MYFWFGPIPIDVTDPFGPSYPQDPTTWTAQQHQDAEILIGTYGMVVAPGGFKVMQTAHTGAVYSYIESGTAVAHIIAAI